MVYCESRGKTTSKTLDALFAHVWTFGDDGRAMHFRNYTDTTDFLRSLG